MCRLAGGCAMCLWGWARTRALKKNARPTRENGADREEKKRAPLLSHIALRTEKRDADTRKITHTRRHTYTRHSDATALRRACRVELACPGLCVHTGPHRDSRTDASRSHTR